MQVSDPVALEMARIVRRAAEPIMRGDQIGLQIERAARRLGLTPGQAKRLWDREARRIPTPLANRLRAFDARAALLNDELDALKARLAALREG